MEEILIILSLVILIIVAGIKGLINKKTNLLNQKLDFLYKEVSDLKHLLSCGPAIAAEEVVDSREKPQPLPGNKHARMPHYDLGYFENAIKGHIPPLHIEAFQEEQTAQEKKGFELFGSAYWLWAGLVFVVALLLWMSGKMLREMKGK